MNAAEIDHIAKAFADVVLVERFAGIPEAELTARFAELLPPPDSDENDNLRALAFRKLVEYVTERWAHVVIPEPTYWN